MGDVTPKYFVKFIPYNLLAVSSLINRQVYFSKVYQFNDFNELNVISHVDNELKFHHLVSKYFDDINFKMDFLKYYPEQGSYRSFNQNINPENLINDFKNLSTADFLKHSPSYVSVMLEWIAYYSVGIFCLSDLRVLENDSAMVMFAHYGNNLKGLACIYEVLPEQEHLPQEIKYSDGPARPSQKNDFDERIFQWEAENYLKIDERFFTKSIAWEYEREWRLFSTPGIKSAAEVGIKLRGILYTSRFDSNEIKTLKEINEHFYKNTLITAELRPSITDFEFNIIVPPTWRKSYDGLYQLLEFNVLRIKTYKLPIVT